MHVQDNCQSIRPYNAQSLRVAIYAGVCPKRPSIYCRSGQHSMTYAHLLMTTRSGYHSLLMGTRVWVTEPKCSGCHANWKSFHRLHTAQHATSTGRNDDNTELSGASTFCSVKKIVINLFISSGQHTQHLMSRFPRRRPYKVLIYRYRSLALSDFVEILV